LRKEKIVAKVNVSTLEHEHYEFEDTIKLIAKTNRGCVMRIGRKYYAIASPFETVYSFERRWDSWTVFLIAILFEMLAISVYLNINLWYEFYFRPDIGGYAMLILSAATTFTAAFLASRSQVVGIRLKEYPLAPDSLFLAEDDGGFFERVKDVELSQDNIRRILHRAIGHEKPASSVVDAKPEQEFEIAAKGDHYLVIPMTIVNEKNTTVKAIKGKSGNDVFYRSSFDHGLNPEIQKAIEILLKTETIPATQVQIKKQMEKKVKGYFASKDPRMDLFLKTVLYLVMCLSGLVEVVGSKNDLQEATINNLRNNVSDYSHALLDSREIKKDIDPNLKGSTKRRKNLKISLNHYMIYIVITIAFLVLFLIYWGSTHNWF
jgi:hypothetical protein